MERIRVIAHCTSRLDMATIQTDFPIEEEKVFVHVHCKSLPSQEGNIFSRVNFDVYAAPDDKTCPICLTVVGRQARTGGITWSSGYIWHSRCRKLKLMEQAKLDSERLGRQCALCEHPIDKGAEAQRLAAGGDEFSKISANRTERLTKLLLRAVGASTRFCVFRSYLADLERERNAAFYHEFWKVSDYAKTPIVLEYLNGWHRRIREITLPDDCVAILPLPGDGGMGMTLLNIENGDEDT